MCDNGVMLIHDSWLFVLLQASCSGVSSIVLVGIWR